MFTVLVMHELGHIFVTYLNKGRSNTPPPFYGNVAGISQGTRGEAGRKLQEMLFGGVVGFYRHPKGNDGQVCSDKCPLITCWYLSVRTDVYSIARSTFSSNQERCPSDLGRLNQ